MSDEQSATVRVFGCLYELRCERDLPTTLQVDVPEEGTPASEIALELSLPLEQIEGVFCNGTVYPLDRVVHAGDRVAFVPYGTPGPHRFNLGLYSAGKRDTTGD